MSKWFLVEERYFTDDGGRYSLWDIREKLPGGDRVVCRELQFADAQAIVSLRQELERSRVNEGEAMLVLEGTEAKLEEAKRAREALLDVRDRLGHQLHHSQAELEETKLKILPQMALDTYDAAMDDLQSENEKLRDELEQAKRPIASYACERCGRADGLDAAVTGEVWEQLSGRTDSGGLLCLWCMDALAAEKGIIDAVMLHFAGRALSGSDGSTIWDDNVLTEELLEQKSRTVKMEAENEKLRAALREVMSCLDKVGALRRKCSGFVELQKRRGKQ